MRWVIREAKMSRLDFAYWPRGKICFFFCCFKGRRRKNKLKARYIWLIVTNWGR
jgi:hypothetical protein